jgi:hypothetical protein
MIQLLLRKKIELILHPSGEYFCGFRANDASYSMTTAIDNEQVAAILHYRSLISHGKQSKISSQEEMLQSDDVLKLVRLLRGDDAYTCEREVWEYRYEIELKGQCREQYFPIDDLPSLKVKSDYLEKYRKWKLSKYT